MADEVTLMLEFQAGAPFSVRVRIALAEKGVKYDVYSEQNPRDEIRNLLLQMNSVSKQLPTLIHNGRPVCQSLIIVQYVDDVWKGKGPLLPSDPYQRAQSRFWADFIDKKVHDQYDFLMLGLFFFRIMGALRGCAFSSVVLL
ncbi:hypothetical protein H0E87_021125 [Populus deltoides]|uniref:Glutathione S-transferase n=1 Tax=Populus deltoides TaxID=3696 RepID=A0A8T2XNA8_POPDE|nr:hypothetical protein H0E87_021125 [Populus deltoides]